MTTGTIGLLERSAGCGELAESDADAGREVVLTGWVHRRRDLGGLIFVDLRDATGRVQVLFDPSESVEAHATAETLRAEYVVGLRGRVVRRESPNPRQPGGMIEVRAAELVVHNRAESVPFPIDEEAIVNEEARLTHRYVELRRPTLQRRLRLRHRLARASRAVLENKGFIEIETPMLTRSTPEGARDYLVPSRVHPGSFYALPQSPQLFKQLLMVAGFERYYQFARCFRDEDLRADRQPEFTQIDLELSFATAEQIYQVIEELVAAQFREIDVEIPRPFPRLTWADVTARYGTDRPDIRFGLELCDPGSTVHGTGFQVFDAALAENGIVRGIAVPGGGSASRRQFDEWTAVVRDVGARGLVWIKREGTAVQSSALKLLGEQRCREIASAIGAGENDAALIVAGDREVTARALSLLRCRVAADMNLIPPDRWSILWVEDFPLLQWDEAEKRWVACHHPFTAPRWDELDLLATDPGAVRAQAYDLVLNGVEIGGGSIRIHSRGIQERVFAALGIDGADAERKFGFLLRALDSGAPPHGGIALGFDRISAMLSRSDSIRDVIAFPKTTSASCLMTDSPSPIDDAQLRELRLAIQRPD